MSDAPPSYQAALSQSQGPSQEKKYIMVNGVMKLNPKWTKPGAPPNSKPSKGNADDALAFPTNMDDYAAMNSLKEGTAGTSVQMAESTVATLDIMQDAEFRKAIAADEEIVDELGRIFSRHEIPLGLMNKLLMLSEFSSLDFLIDDSGSMNLETDSVDAQGRVMSRWGEARTRMIDMLEVLAYVPIKKVTVRFMNRRDTASLERTPKQTPEAFAKLARETVEGLFTAPPGGGTPALNLLQSALAAARGTSAAFYLFCDGVPSGGQAEIDAIKRLVMDRPNPEQHPITFISCTNDDAAVEWMKDVEEVAPFVSELDDYEDEAREVLRDQGYGFPFTPGFHLICQLCAAMNPHDLDAMDDSVPFTRETLSNLLGINLGDHEYEHYFSRFLEAQKAQRPKWFAASPLDALRRETDWRKHYREFLAAPRANEIAAVAAYRAKLSGRGVEPVVQAQSLFTRLGVGRGG
mmetsp:Transcript_27581/g.92234  ORF Transcript_27581/g.92234 Transcript_27581/m.92234 type:complete len:463 (-) Transcript_27581:528-1916(-)